METFSTVLALLLIPAAIIGIGFKIRAFTVQDYKEANKTNHTY